MEKEVRLIYVDLDRTLIRTDLLEERLIVGALRAYTLVFKALLWFAQGGRVRLKTEMAERHPISPANLPYNQELLGFLRDRKEQGTRLVLATGAPRVWAESVARHLGIFDLVLATDKGAENLKGGQKLKSILLDANGERFGYAGDARSDLPIFEASQLPVVVGNDRKLAGKNAANALLIKWKCATSNQWWMSLRFHQWSKNVLVFIPLLAAHRFDGTWLNGVLAFLAFCCTASALYVVNDLHDLDLDRHHPDKQARSLARGTLTPFSAILLIVVLGGAAVGLLYFLTPAFGIVLTGYALFSFLYSRYIKKFPVFDVFALGFLYSMRVFAGGVACGISISPWLGALVFFLALSLAHLKRYQELIQRNTRRLSNAARPAYTVEDAPLLAMTGIGSGLISVAVTALYVTLPSSYAQYKMPGLLFAVCLLQFYWIERIWLLCFRAQISSDPVEFIVRDKLSYAIGLMALLLMWIAFFL